MNLSKITQYIVNHYPPHFNVLHGFFLGIALKHTIKNGKYWHIPLFIFTPGIYVGYQFFNIFTPFNIFKK